MCQGVTTINLSHFEIMSSVLTHLIKNQTTSLFLHISKFDKYSSEEYNYIMWFPWRKKLLRPTWGNFIYHILFPGVFILYFVLTEPNFCQSFKDQFEIMMFGEYFYLIIHMTFVYYILPIVWFFELFVFARVAIPGVEIQRDIFVLLSNGMFTALVIMTLMKLLVEVF